MSAADALLGELPLADTVVLGALPIPGRATPVGAGSPRDFDIRKLGAYSGAATVFTGDNVTRFDIIVDIWTPAQWALWQVFAKTLERSPPGIPPVRYGVKHPALNAPPLRITVVVIEDVTQFEPDEDGMLTCRIKCLQWRPMVPAGSKPVAEIPAVAKKVPTAADAADAEIQKLLAQSRSLGGAL